VIVIPANAGIHPDALPAPPERFAEASRDRDHFHGNDRMEKSCQENKKMPDNSMSELSLVKYVFDTPDLLHIITTS